MQKELVLCVGMHRSGTSLTASLLQAIGLPLPGQLIGADVANPTGYFENRSVVDAQELLLQELGYWWPTEAASHGLPRRLRRSSLYRAHQDWLTAYLGEIFAHQGPRLAIKDPRTSLLLPAWRTAAGRLGIRLKLVICLRNPRDVCWSLVWRDGLSVGMGWRRAQRLWLEHYRAVLVDGRGLPAQVAVYDHWLEPTLAEPQLLALAQFLGLKPTAEQRRAALARVKPEFNHGGGDQVAPVARSLRLLHRCLRQPRTRRPHQGLWAAARVCGLALRAEQGLREARTHLHLLQILSAPDARQPLAPALDRQLLREQLGGTSLWRYWWHFGRHEDLRLHPLISPAHLNRERQRCGLPPLRGAGDLLRHLLDADLIPLNPHPWFDCRTYQQRAGLLGRAGEHPVLTYLRRAASGAANPYPAPGWLQRLGASRPLAQLEALPPLIQHLHPGAVLADAVAALGDPAGGEAAVIEAHENHWRMVQAMFSSWPAEDPQGPLRWLSAQADLAGMGSGGARPAGGLACWGVSGDWATWLLAELAGADPDRHRSFTSPQTLRAALASEQPHEPPPLLALTPTLLAMLLAEGTSLPANCAVLNLSWPEPSEQSAWLHLLARTSLVLECRPAVRAYLLGLGLPVTWPRAAAGPTALQPESGGRHLLLALRESSAEAALAGRAEQLDPQRYSAYLRLDAQLVSLGEEPAAAGLWLTTQRRCHDRWIWLTGPPEPDDLKAWALRAWAEQHRVALTPLDPGDRTWLESLRRQERSA